LNNGERLKRAAERERETESSAAASSTHTAALTHIAHIVFSLYICEVRLFFRRCALHAAIPRVIKCVLI
jgi:hypothetical protein